MSAQRQSNDKASIQELLKLRKSSDPGNATLAASQLDQAMDNLWTELEDEEARSKKRRCVGNVLAGLEVIGFILASFSSAFWLWSALQPEPTAAAQWNARAALCAVFATLAIMALRGTSNWSSKTGQSARDATNAAILVQGGAQLDVEKQLNEIAEKLAQFEQRTSTGAKALSRRCRSKRSPLAAKYPRRASSPAVSVRRRNTTSRPTSNRKGR